MFSRDKPLGETRLSRQPADTSLDIGEVWQLVWIVNSTWHRSTRKETQWGTTRVGLAYACACEGFFLIGIIGLKTKEPFFEGWPLNCVRDEEVSRPGSIHFSLLLTVEMIGPTVSSICCPNFPAAVDRNLEAWALTNSSAADCFLSGYFSLWQPQKKHWDRMGESSKSQMLGKFNTFGHNVLSCSFSICVCLFCFL